MSILTKTSGNWIINSALFESLIEMMQLLKAHFLIQRQ